MTYQEFKINLWNQLDLDNRSITFHIVDSEFGLSIGSGIVESSDDLYDTDFTDTMLDNADAPNIDIYSVESWLLGNGEAEHADCIDCGNLQEAMMKCQSFFDRLIQDLADPLCTVGECTLENPFYEPDDDDDWDDNDADLDD